MSEQPKIDVTYGEQRIVIDCPHIEGGACGPCVAAAIVPFLSAKDSLDYVVTALRALEAVLVQAAGGTSKLLGHAEKLAARTWTVAPADDRAPPPSQTVAEPPNATGTPGTESSEVKARGRVDDKERTP